ncbi:hypothetical protein [Sphingobium yanoikuyae]|uniref:hypothetical protein n=1 Tax=Sphingobium yanoikuyae TaxID=13690 RepID=UPI002FDA72EE
MTASSSQPLNSLMVDAQWLAHRYDPGQDSFHFLQLPRARHGEIPFLTDEYIGQAVKPRVIRREEAIAAAPLPAPLHFIFHSAYCCSTLLAAAFDRPAIAMGLKEPVLLNDIVGWRHRGAKGPEAARALDHGLRLLARPFSAGEAVVIKPSNLINPLIPGIMAMWPSARALFLHAPLDAYLASIARKGMWGRLWVRDLFGKLLREGMVDLGVAPSDYLGLTDIQIAALGWLAQHAQFQALTAPLGERVRTLNSDALIARPGESMTALARHFDIAFSDDDIAAIVAGPIFGRNAKTGADFAPGQRERAASEGKALHAEEVEKVAEWAMLIARNNGIAMDLARPLFG